MRVNVESNGSEYGTVQPSPSIFHPSQPFRLAACTFSLLLSTLDVLGRGTFVVVLTSPEVNAVMVLQHYFHPSIPT